MTEYHTSVLLNEAIDYLHVTKDEKYIDATLGGGGHTSRILELGGKVLALDVDEDAIEYVEEILNSQISNLKYEGRLFLARGNFRNIRQIAEEHGFENVSGVLFDLGVSSHQFDEAERGFSFGHDAPLDMRMDQHLAITAADLVNGLTKDELTELFIRYGEEPFAKRIAKTIVTQRKQKKIETTKELAEIAKHSYPRAIHSLGPSNGKDTKKKIHPATRIFQALRIAVNDELHSLEEAIEQAETVLRPGGRIIVISFHSLEDRIVKQAFIAFEKQQKGEVITKKPVEPTDEEIETNTRSRSARLRVFQKA